MREKKWRTNSLLVLSYLAQVQLLKYWSIITSKTINLFISFSFFVLYKSWNFQNFEYNFFTQDGWPDSCHLTICNKKLFLLFFCLSMFFSIDRKRKISHVTDRQIRFFFSTDDAAYRVIFLLLSIFLSIFCQFL